LVSLASFPLGKKYFFQQASTALLLCHSLICGEMGEKISEDMKRSLLFDGPGLEFTHQVLNLAKGIATSSSSTGSTSSEQIFITHQLLQTISIALSDNTLCADLLEEVRPLIDLWSDC
jgi:hypothetical protein